MNLKDEALEAALTALKYNPSAYGYQEIVNIAIQAIEKALKTKEPHKPERGDWFYEN
jgi:hypothetical protein